jgi:hypothetical protein
VPYILGCLALFDRKPESKATTTTSFQFFGNLYTIFDNLGPFWYTMFAILVFLGVVGRYTLGYHL